MLDDLLDVFDRDKRRGHAGDRSSAKRGGLSGLLGRVSAALDGDADDRHARHHSSDRHRDDRHPDGRPDGRYRDDRHGAAPRARRRREIFDVGDD